MSVWFAAAWLLAMVLLAAWVARAVGSGTTHRERVAEDDRRRAIRRLLAEAKPQVRPARMEAWTEDEAPECPHGNPGGVTSAGTPRCPQCRRAAQRGRSGPFSPSLDGLDRPGGPKPADGLSEPQPPEAVAG